MKICHVITRLVLGGAQENTILTCEGLAARGHDVTLVTGPPIGPEGGLMARARQGAYRTIVVPQMRRAIHPLRDLLTARALRKILRTLRPDIMHSHSSKAGIVARRAARQVGGMKVVHTIHGLPFHPHQSPLARALYVSLERRAARDSDALISVADSMTAQALAAGVGRGGQFTTIYSGMEVDAYLSRCDQDDTFRTLLELPDDAIVVTQVARLAPLKGHACLLETAQRIDDPRVHFCFVGDGPIRRRIEADIACCGLDHRVHLTGLIAPDLIPAVMHASDVLAHCSLHEGLPRAVVQAMLAERPVVCFDVDGAREVVSDETGVLLPVGDIDGLAAALERLAGDPSLRQRLGRAGRRRCVDDFDHVRMVDRIESLYKKLCGQ